MFRAKAFFYIAAGVFLLALSYHLGARNATAQAPGNPVVAMTGTGDLWAMTANGDLYYSTGALGWVTWEYRSNVFGGSPTPGQRESSGALKTRYRGERGAARPTDR